MRAVRIIAILVLVYAGLVVAFESLLGYYQPSSQGTIVITTTDADGETHDRVVSRLDSDGQLYVAANHWPRAWYNQALANRTCPSHQTVKEVLISPSRSAARSTIESIATTRSAWWVAY